MATYIIHNSAKTIQRNRFSATIPVLQKFLNSLDKQHEKIGIELIFNKIATLNKKKKKRLNYREVIDKKLQKLNNFNV